MPSAHLTDEMLAIQGFAWLIHSVGKLISSFTGQPSYGIRIHRIEFENFCAEMAAEGMSIGIHKPDLAHPASGQMVEFVLYKGQS